MANTITINFTPCTPTPANGYRVKYRKIGDIAYIDYPLTFSESPAVFDDEGAEPDGTEYEGLLYSDCGGGNFGPGVPWSTLLCAAGFFVESSIPDATANTPYNQILNLSGTPPFVLGAVTKPTWMNVSIVGNTVILNGTPDDGDVLSGATIQIQVSNCGGSIATFTDSTFAVLPDGCVCIRYRLKNNTIVDRDFTYVNCDGDAVEDELNPSETRIICACEGTVSAESGVTVTNQGAC